MVGLTLATGCLPAITEYWSWPCPHHVMFISRTKSGPVSRYSSSGYIHVILYRTNAPLSPTAVIAHIVLLYSNGLRKEVIYKWMSLFNGECIGGGYLTRTPPWCMQYLNGWVWLTLYIYCRHYGVLAITMGYWPGPDTEDLSGPAVVRLDQGPPGGNRDLIESVAGTKHGADDGPQSPLLAHR